MGTGEGWGKEMLKEDRYVSINLRFLCLVVVVVLVIAVNRRWRLGRVKNHRVFESLQPELTLFLF